MIANLCVYARQVIVYDTRVPAVTDPPFTEFVLGPFERYYTQTVGGDQRNTHTQNMYSVRMTITIVNGTGRSFWVTKNSFTQVSKDIRNIRTNSK